MNIRSDTAEKYFKLLEKIRKVARVFGGDIFGPNFKPSFRTYLWATWTASLLLSYIVMLFQKPTIMFIFEGMITFLLASQGLTKICVLSAYSKEYYNIFDRIKHMHVDHEKLYENADCLKKCIDRCSLISKFLGVCYIGVFILYCCLPVVSYMYFNTFLTLFPLHLPFLDITSTFGYVVNLAHQSIILGIGTLGVLGFDVAFILGIMHYIPTVNLLKIGFDELDVELLSGTKDIEKIRQKIHSAIEQHQTIIDYMVALNQTLSIIGGVKISTAAGCLVISIFLFVWQKWIVGPILIIVSIFQIGEYCIMGTVCQIQNEVVADLIYNTLWYLMAVPEQKLILFMLMQASSPRELLAGKFAKLNVETFMQVLKTVYSMTMMIIEFLN